MAPCQGQAPNERSRVPSSTGTTYSQLPLDYTLLTAFDAFKSQKPTRPETIKRPSGNEPGKENGHFAGKNKEISLKTEFITSSLSTFLSRGVCMSVYGSFIYPSRKELHPMEAVVESCCALRFNCYWLDRLSELPA